MNRDLRACAVRAGECRRGSAPPASISRMTGSAVSSIRDLRDVPLAELAAVPVHVLAPEHAPEKPACFQSSI